MLESMSMIFNKEEVRSRLMTGEHPNINGINNSSISTKKMISELSFSTLSPYLLFKPDPRSNFKSELERLESFLLAKKHDFSLLETFTTFGYHSDKDRKHRLGTFYKCTFK